MDGLSDQSVHLIVTSPPYWQLKDYGHTGQIGFDDSYEDYINNLNLVWSECNRVLKPGCRLCINIGDQFARSIYYGRYKVIPIRTEIIKFCETIGLDYMGAVIWQKNTTTNTTGGASVMGSFPFPRNGILKIDYEFILIFKKTGVAPIVTKDAKEVSKLTTKEWNEFFAGHWHIKGERQQEHMAMFPLQIPQRLIRMFSFVGETILDPFLGSGTTSLAAMGLERSSVGYEVNEEFLGVIETKLHSMDLIQKSTIHIEHQRIANSDFAQRIESHAYRFRDPIKFDKKIDPRKLSFGSKISSEKKNETKDYYRVAQILSPNKIILNSQLEIKLIGIDINPQTATKAEQFLAQKVQGQQVFLKFDRQAFSANGELLAYLYLKNKTFINAHLVRSGLVMVDETTDYKLKHKFQQLLRELNG